MTGLSGDSGRSGKRERRGHYFRLMAPQLINRRPSVGHGTTEHHEASASAHVARHQLHAGARAVPGHAGIVERYHLLERGGHVDADRGRRRVARLARAVQKHVDACTINSLAGFANHSRIGVRRVPTDTDAPLRDDLTCCRCRPALNILLEEDLKFFFGKASKYGQRVCGAVIRRPRRAARPFIGYSAPRSYVAPRRRS